MFLIPNNAWVIKNSHKKGKGVFAKKDITGGITIGDYLGKIIPKIYVVKTSIIAIMGEQLIIGEGEKADFSQELEAKVKKQFPIFTQTDKSRFKEKLIQDVNGSVLTFLTEDILNAGNPSMLFIFRPSGFVINYYNMPEPSLPYTRRLRVNSQFSLIGNILWTEDEVDMAIETVKIQTEGIDHTNKDFRKQISGWDNKRKRFLTMGERIDLGEESGVVSVRSLLRRNPKLAEALAIARVNSEESYNFFTTVLPSQQVIAEIEASTALGKKVMLRELNIIMTYEKLLVNLIPVPQSIPYVPDNPQSFEEMFPKATAIKKQVRTSPQLAQRLGFVRDETISRNSRPRIFRKSITGNDQIHAAIEFDDIGQFEKVKEERIILYVGGTTYDLKDFEDDEEFRDMYFSANIPKGERGDFDKIGLKTGGYTRLMVFLDALEKRGFYRRKISPIP